MLARPTMPPGVPERLEAAVTAVWCFAVASGIWPITLAYREIDGVHYLAAFAPGVTDLPITSATVREDCRRNTETDIWLEPRLLN